MRHNLLKKISVILLFVFSGIFVSVAAPIPELGTGSVMMQPRKAKKAQKKQDRKEKEKKKSVKEGSKETRKRSYEIQTADVQARMKQNQKNISVRDKAQKKNSKARTKQGAKKYK